MELSVSSPKQSVLSPPDCMSDPEEEHEISEEEDDDRNHKHRRKEETRAQSLEQDSSDQAFSRPYRKNYRHYENGNSFSENEKRSFGTGSGQRVQFDNQRMRSNPIFSRDSGPGRGRGNYGSWAQRDSRFNPVDLSSHMVQVGSMAQGMFGGRGLAGVSAAQSAPWPPFGMIPGVPNGGLDGFHHLQGSLRPPLNAPLNMGIPRQRCRDFEERGFCLRGDMCPMEHGMNRIVVDDVQSLSQFNLPVSVPGAPHLAASSKPVPAQFGGANFMNPKGAHGRTNEGGMAVDGLGYGDAYPSAGGTDFYDPDQPLWNNSTGETSGAISTLNSHGVDENVAPLDDSNQDGAENGCGIRDSRSISQSVWGRMRGSNSQANSKEKADAVLNSSAGPEDQLKEVSVNSSRHGKQNHVGESVAKVVDSSNISNDMMNNSRKPTQKAMRTLFVNNVPHESNRRDLILAHFQKFGKVIDIHIPVNSERAFVQFSKREEAESALRAPDAVMGNRFIKLWWANRDSIPDNGLSSGTGASMKGRGMTASGPQNQFPIAAASKSNHVSSIAKVPAFHTGGAPSSSEQPKPVVATSGPKVTPLQQKKADTLERLKETLRKKQEMLEKKRNEYRKKLATLEKQGTVVKGEEVDEPDAKRVKVDTASDSGAAIASPKPESSTDKKVPIQKPLSTAKLSTETPSPDSKNLKQRPYTFTTSLNTPMVNRYKLDNRTTTIKVVPPLPTGLADVAVLKEHFSSYGEVSKVELEDNASIGSGKDHETQNENRAACVTFVKRSTAEKAFANAKCWQEHTLQLVWVTRQSNKESNNNNNNSNSLSVSHDHLSSKNKCASVSNDPKPAVEVKASSTEEPDTTNFSGDNDSTLDKRETKESDNDNNKSNHESMEGASDAIATSGTDEEQSEQIHQ
ncbi:RNA recognition motif domain [Arabidopsis thaliana x Arabidopsis arenosa]|uniref:RNA recognition motif domain n=1 Tax=Arabidopsis thaliana x Arabidopsis arenosa TaxID=1240361 RepID=A0A8T1ZIJ9_9BRAS|nr:RNA recognition motif domain [Arabidopsis thaliana x Arabidopsis arenosa]